MSEFSSQQIEAELFDRYIAGECTPAELDIVNAWISTSPGAGGMLGTLKSLHARPGDADHTEHLERKALANVAQRISSNRESKGATSSFGIRNWSRWAMGIGALIVVGIAIHFAGHLKSTTVATASSKVYTTNAGQRATITLADGSTVILAPATKLEVRGRHVELEGQAVFTVNQQNQDPFTVRVGNADVRVLGTTFGLRKYVADTSVRIAIAVGKISVANSVLSAGDAAAVLKDGTTRITHNADMTPDLGWTSGTLVINKMLFRDAIPELERWYGITIRADESILSRTIRTELQTASAQDAMSILAFTLQARAQRNGNVVTFLQE